LLLKEIRQNSVEEGEVGDCSLELAEDIFWFPSKDAFKKCGPNCKYTIYGRVQNLSRKCKQITNECPVKEICPPDGAVIFGENSILDIYKMQQATTMTVLTDNAFEDSRLGSSLQSSVTTRASPMYSDVSQVDSQSTPPSSASRNRASTSVSDDNYIHATAEASSVGVPHISGRSANGRAHPPTRPLASIAQKKTTASIPKKMKDPMSKKGAKHMLRRLANRMRNL
jgi:hypothetical protein